METIKYEEIKSKIITLRNLPVLLDRDVAALYGVETKRVNEAVKNNSDKFPSGYIFELTKSEKDKLVENFHQLESKTIKKSINSTNTELVENFDQFEKFKHSSALPKAFTEKGLYMLATILKSPKATETTIAIIETYSKIKELSRTISELSNITDKTKQKPLMKKSGNLIAEILDDDLQTNETETTIELNFAVLKFKHTIKRK